MKNKGFTLIELLAVIVLLAIIISIVSITVGRTISDSEKSLSATQKNIIEHAAETYYIEDGRNYNITCVNLMTLINKGYLKADQVKDPKTKEIMDGSVKITVYGKKYSYDYRAETCKICTKVTEATIGNVPSGNYAYGDEYECEVGNNYSNIFFVLENNADTVSLIMKENFTDSYIPKTLPWCIDGGSDNTTCKNITATGSNAPEGKNYLGHIKNIFNKDGVEVNFPSFNQIKDKDIKNNQWIIVLPIWLHDYLDGTTHPVSGVYGYWTTTPANGDSSYAYQVNYAGALVTNDGGVSNDRNNGIRPVITISKSLIK